MEERPRKRSSQYRQNQLRLHPQITDPQMLQRHPRLLQNPLEQEAIMGTFNLSDGVLRGADGQTLQLISVNSDLVPEQFHNTLSTGELISGQLVNGMLVNFTTALHPPEVLIDANDGGQANYSTMADATIMQYESAIGGNNGTQLIVSNKHPVQMLATSKKRVGSSGALNLPPLAPFSGVQHHISEQMNVSVIPSKSAAVPIPANIHLPQKQLISTSPPMMVQVENLAKNVCEICSTPFSSQLEFFRHLQTHYEPDTVAVTPTKQTSITEKLNIELPPLAIMQGSHTSATSATEYESMKLLSEDTKPCIDDCKIMVVNMEGQMVCKDEELFEQQEDMKYEDGNNLGNDEEDDGTEWIEDGDIGEEVIYEVTELQTDDPLVARQNVEVIEQHIDEEQHIDSAVAVDESSTSRIESETTAHKIITGKRKNALSKKSTLASQMECFEEILVTPSNDEGSGIKTRNRPRRNMKRDASGGDVTASDDTTADSGGTTKTYRCRLCDKVCKTKNSLHYHFLLHTGERPHQCDECGKGFFANSALKVHMRLHTGDKPYTCEVCSRAFRQWGDLRYHMTSLHSDEKNHQCEFCGKDFARRYSLVIHRRIHTGERNYKCDFCDKTFRASTYLQDHRRIHTGEKPHECETCGKKFRVRGDLKRHWNIHLRSKSSALTPVEVKQEDIVADDNVVMFDFSLEQSEEVEETSIAVHNIHDTTVANPDEIVDIKPNISDNKKTAYKGSSGSIKTPRKATKSSKSIPPLVRKGGSRSRESQSH